jgi:phospholipid/cholesterol/gamma-HCH transport system substrate-binding protein/paraquat-inducible protein B
MKAKTRYFKIGLFIIVGLSLAIVGIVLLRAGTLFEKTFVMETYFDESVQGLDVGAPIKHRGVKVVDFVRNLYRSELSPEDLFRFGRYVVVRVTVQDVFPGMSGEGMASVLKAQIEDGLRIRLATQGLTGVVYLEADHLDPKDYPPMPIAWQPAEFYVPSAPSTIKVLGESFNNITKDLEQANIHQVAQDLDTLLVSVKKLIDEAHVQQLGVQAAQTLTDLQSTVQETKRLLESPEIRRTLSDASMAAGGARKVMVDLNQASKRINEVAESLPETMARLDKTLKRVDKFVANKNQALDQTIENLRQISDNVRDLTADAKRYPSQIIFGAPPPRREQSGKP